MYDDAYTRNEDGELAVRTVSTSGDNNTNKDDVFTRDDEGRLAMRTVGGSGGGGGMTQVHHDDTLKGKGTSAEPLGISDEVMEKIEQGGGDFVPQYDTMPTASADNVGEIAQYSGESITDSYQNGYFYKSFAEYGDPSATISQTAGQTDSISFETTVGNTEISGTTEAVRAWFAINGWSPTTSDTLTFECMDASTQSWRCVCGSQSGYNSASSQSWYEPLGFVFTGEPQTGDIVVCTYTLGNIYNLSVDVDTFVEAAQPTQSGSTAFTCVVSTETLSPTSFSVGGATFIFDTDTFLSSIRVNMSDVNIEQVAIFKLEITSQNDVTVYAYDNNEAVLGNIGVSITGLETFYGLTIDGTFVFDSQTDLLMQHTAASVSWTLNSETVDLAEYGISYSGTPVDGDTLTVAYTAPAPIGYTWKQTDVQPSSGGGNAGIEWKIKSDLEVGDYGQRWLAIPSGLPNGTYEYYIQIKRTPSEFGYRPLGYATYKVVMKIDNDNQQYRALVNPVLDGDYATTVFAKMRDYDEGQTIFISGSDMIFSLSTFRTNIPDYSPAETIVDCYKLSTVKNVDTGQEYVGTLLENEPQSFDATRSIIYCFGSVDELPYVPKYAGSGTLYFENGDYVNVSDKYYGSDIVMLRIGFRYGFDEYQADMALYRNGHSIKVRKATGVFAQTEFVKDTDGKIFIKLNAPVGTTGAFYFVIGGISDNSIVNMNMQAPTGTPTVLSTDMVGGIVDTNNIYIISQYIGTTTASYTNGCFYKATGTIVTTPESATCTETTSTGTTITCTNISGLINKLASLTGWSTDYVKESFGQNFFNISQDQASVYYSGYGYWSGQDADDLIACFSFSPALSDSIDFTVQYVPETQEVQNGAWVLVDTQFTGITGYDATKTQVLKNVQGTLTWVDE